MINDRVKRAKAIMDTDHTVHLQQSASHVPLTSAMHQQINPGAARVPESLRGTNYSHVGRGREYVPRQYVGPSVGRPGSHQYDTGNLIHHRSPHTGTGSPVRKFHRQQDAGPSTRSTTVPAEQKLAMWASLFQSESTPQREVVQDFIAQRTSKIHHTSSAVLTSTDGVPDRVSGGAPSSPPKMRKYPTFNSNASTLYPKCELQTLPISRGQMKDGNSNTRRAQYPAYYRLIDSPSAAVDLGVPRGIGSNGFANCRMDQWKAPGRAHSASVQPMAVIGNPSNAGAAKNSSIHPKNVVASGEGLSACVDPKAIMNDPRNAGTTKTSAHFHPKNVVDERTFAPSSHAVHRRITGNMAMNTKASSGNAVGISRPPTLHVSPGNGKAPATLDAGAIRRASLRSAKSRQVIQSNNEDADQGTRGRMRNTSTAAMLHPGNAPMTRYGRGNENPVITRTIARKRHARTIKERAGPSSALRASRRTPRQQRAEVIDVDALSDDIWSPPRFRRNTDDTGRPVRGRHKTRKTPEPRPPIVVTEPSLEEPEPLVPLAVVPAKVAIPRRVPYPRPIAPYPPPPPEELEETCVQKQKNAIAKRFLQVENGYIWHKRSSRWVMHPSYYDKEHPLCEMKKTCRHSRDCHQIRKRMAILAYIKDGISLRESEYVWGISRSCVQRKLGSYKGKISLDFLITPRK